MIHCVILSRGLPSIKYPLNGIFEFDQARALKAIGHEVTYVGLDYRSFFKIRRFGFFKVYKDGIKCILFSFPIGNIELPIFNLLARYITKIGLFLYKKEFKNLNIIHSHFYQISSLAVEFKKSLKIPLIITEHSSTLNKEKINTTTLRLVKYVYHYSDLIISVSEALRSRLKRNFNIESVVIYNVLDINFKNKPEHYNQVTDENDFVFLSVGTLNYNKGFDILIEAFYISCFPTHVKLIIIGDGELKEELNSYVIKKKLENQVLLVGFKNRNAISDYLANSNAFVLASRSETFGLVYVEALSAGLPVIATKCGGPEEIINETNGILVDVDDIKSLSVALIKMRGNPNTYSRSEISAQAYAKYSPENIAHKLTHVYYNVLQL